MSLTRKFVAAGGLAVVLCGGCRDQARTPDPGTSRFDQIDSTLASIESEVDRP